MGEYAEMMLDGTCCEGCGVYLESDSGFTNYCGEQCARDRGATWWLEMNGFEIPAPESVAESRCPICGKRCKSDQGVADHTRAKHPSHP